MCPWSTQTHPNPATCINYFILASMVVSFLFAIFYEFLLKLYIFSVLNLIGIVRTLLYFSPTNSQIKEIAKVQHGITMGRLNLLEKQKTACVHQMKWKLTYIKISYVLCTWLILKRSQWTKYFWCPHLPTEHNVQNIKFK